MRKKVKVKVAKKRNSRALKLKKVKMAPKTVLKVELTERPPIVTLAPDGASLAIRSPSMPLPPKTKSWVDFLFGRRR